MTIAIIAEKRMSRVCRGLRVECDRKNKKQKTNKPATISLFYKNQQSLHNSQMKEKKEKKRKEK